MADFPRIAFTARDFLTIKAELSDFIRETRPDVWSDFFESNLGNVLIELAALVGDMLSATNDATATELFLATCRRYESGLRFARSIGYVPRSANSAEVTMRSQLHPDPLILVGGTIPKGSSIEGVNGLSYELLEDYVIAAGDTVSRPALHEGKTYTEEFTPSTKANQQITSANSIVEDQSWVLYVGDPNLAPSLWAAVDNVLFEDAASKTYSYHLDGSGRLVISFGDGISGKIPDDLITLVYRTTHGAEGNAPVGSITGALQVNLVGGGTASVNYVNKDTDTSAGGGTLLHNGESQGVTAASVNQSGILAVAPISAGTVVLTFVLQSGGGTLVLQDNGNGTLSAVTNTTGRSVVSASIIYSTGAWALVLGTAFTAAGTISANYFSITTGSQIASVFTGAATGGADRESLDELRRNIPAYLRSQDKILTLQDYDDNVRRVAGIALTFTDRYVSSYKANAVLVHIWSNEDVTFRSESSDGTFSVAPYTRYSQVAQNRVNEVHDFLRERTLFNLHNIVLRPAMLWLDLYCGEITYDRRYPKADVHQAITDAVVAVFEEGSGFEIRLADLYDAVRTAKGVKYFTLQRIASGTQETSTEIVAGTTVSPTVAGTLLLPIVTPGSLTITVEQPSGDFVLEDNGSGGFTLESGPSGVTLSSGTVNYRTGAFSLTFSASLVGNQTVYAAYSNVTEDFRHDQIVTLNAVSDNDAWPPPGVGTVNPITTPPYKDGLPLFGTRLVLSVPTVIAPPYASGDKLEYAKLKDINVNALAQSANFYDETYQFNNEIYYDSVESITSNVRAINLRRLVFDLIPG